MYCSVGEYFDLVGCIFIKFDEVIYFGGVFDMVICYKLLVYYVLIG